MIDTPIHFDKQPKEISVQNNEEHDLFSPQVIGMTESKPRGELLQTDQSNPKPEF